MAAESRIGDTHSSNFIESKDAAIVHGLGSSTAASLVNPQDGITYRIVQVPVDAVQAEGNLINVLSGVGAMPVRKASQQHQNMTGSVSLPTAMANNSATMLTLPKGGTMAITPNAELLQNSFLTATAGTSSDNSMSNHYYVVMSPGELLQVAASAAVQQQPQVSVLPARAVSMTGDGGVQRATFIPLSKIELPAQTSSSKVNVSGEAAFHDYSGGKDRRRSSHNEVEKRRRDKINTWIFKLASMIPSVKDEPMKQSKGSVLLKTIQYVQELRVTNAQLAEAYRTLKSSSGVEKLQRTIDALAAENKRLRATLAEAGVAVAESKLTTVASTFLDQDAELERTLSKATACAVDLMDTGLDDSSDVFATGSDAHGAYADDDD